MTFEKMPFEKMTFEKMTFEKMTFEKMNVEKMTFEKMTFEKMTFEKMTFEKMTFDKMTFEKNFRSVSKSDSQKLVILRMSWRVFHVQDILLIGICFWGFALPVLEYCSAVWCSTADTHHKLLDRIVSGACFFNRGVWLSATLHIVELWQYYVPCIRSGVTRCTLSMMLYLCRMCQCVARGASVSHRFIYSRLLAAELRSTRGFLFPSQYNNNNTNNNNNFY